MLIDFSFNKFDDLIDRLSQSAGLFSDVVHSSTIESKVLHSPAHLKSLSSQTPSFIAEPFEQASLAMITTLSFKTPIYFKQLSESIKAEYFQS